MTQPRVHHVYFCQFEDTPIFMDLSQFLRLPRATRALLIVKNEVEFLDDKGWTVPLHEALADLIGSWMEHQSLELVSDWDPAHERRRHQRFPFRRNAELNGSDAAVIEDISKSGMLLRTRRTFEEGDTIDVLWGSAYTDHHESRRKAVVKRVASDPPERGSLFPVTVAVEFETQTIRQAV